MRPLRNIDYSQRNMAKEIEGLSALKIQLQNIGNVDTTDAMVKGAEVLMDESQTNAPVDTGELRDSHYVESIDQRRADVIVDAEHAAPVEFGTYKMAAQPYLRPAIDMTENEIVNTIGDEIEQLIRNEI